VAAVVMLSPDCSWLDWQPTSKNIANAEINDPHGHRVKRFGWFIYFCFIYGIYEGLAEYCNACISATSEKIPDLVSIY
jgi:hypothetical protein